MLVAFRMHVFYGVLRGIALLSDVWVWYFAEGLKLVSDDDEEDGNETVDTQPKLASIEPAQLDDDGTDSKIHHRSRHSSSIVGNNATDDQRSRQNSQSLAANGARYVAVSQNTPEHLQLSVAL